MIARALALLLILAAPVIAGERLAGLALFCISTHDIAAVYWLQCRRHALAELEELAPYSARGESSGVHIDIEVGRRAPEAFEQDRIDAPHAPG
jgi:hypothetical protein